MFTLKKLAFVGVAGLAAFAISCSDTTDDPGGTITGFAAVDDGTDVNISGTITANTGATVEGLTIKAGSNTLSISPAFSPAATVNLSNYAVGGVCNGLTGAQSLKFEITVTFSEGGNLVETTTANVTCNAAPGGGGEALNIWSSFTISSAGESFADLDAKQTYGRAAATPIIDKMDLVAYIPAFGASGDKIYSTWDLNDEAGASKGALFFPIASSDVASLKSATKDTDIATFLAKVADILDGSDIEGGVAIATDAAILVRTDDGNRFAVIVTTTGSSSVTLKSIQLP
jgi:hypothetical protein